MNKAERTVYFFAFIMFFSGFSVKAFSMSTKEARAQIDAIVKDGAWGVVAVSVDEKNLGHRLQNADILWEFSRVLDVAD